MCALSIAALAASMSAGPATGRITAGVKTLANLIQTGASPRATIALAQAGRAYAFLDGRAFVTPQDIKSIAPDVLRHRIIASYEAEAEGLDTDALVARLLEHVVVP